MTAEKLHRAIWQGVVDAKPSKENILPLGSIKRKIVAKMYKNKKLTKAEYSLVYMYNECVLCALNQMSCEKCPLRILQNTYCGDTESLYNKARWSKEAAIQIRDMELPEEYKHRILYIIKKREKKK